MIHGIFYGILIAFAAYFAVQAIRLKNNSALWFVFYVICFSVFLGAFQANLPGFPRSVFAYFNRTTFIIIIGLTFFTGAKFLRVFLNIRVYSRPTDRVLQILQWMGLAFIPINSLPNLVTPFYNIILAGVGGLFSAGVLVFAWIKKVPNAATFCLAWIICNITLEIILLRVFDLISWPSDNLYLLPAALLISIIFFSIAVTNKIRKYREFAYKDDLTGIANRRLFEQVLAIEWNRNLRNQLPLSVIIANIDNFKAFNDKYGRNQGDECIKTIASVFDNNLQRAADFAARYGGDEFIAVLPDTFASEASFLADKIHDMVESMSIKHEASTLGMTLSISLGTGTLIPSAEKSPADIILLADEALFQAKSSGRNRVISLDRAQG